MTATEERRVRTITPEDVVALGTVDDALGRFYVEQVEQAAARTGVSERTIRTWFEEQLLNEQGFRAQVFEGPGGDRAAEVLRLLVDGHLLRTESRRGAVWYELAHDRLINPVLASNAEWRATNLSPLQVTVGLWVRQGRPSRLLMSGAALAEARRWASDHEHELVPADREFLEASRDAEKQKARAGRRRRIAVVVVLVLLATSIFLVVELNRRLQAQRSERLATQALSLLDADPAQAARLGLQGWDVAHTALAEEAVREAASQMFTERSLVGHQAAVNGVAVSPNGSRILTVSADDTARTWDASSGAPLLTLRGHAGPLLGGRFTGDGAAIVTWSEDDTVRSWRAVDGRPIGTLGTLARFWGKEVGVSSRGHLVAFAGEDHDAEVRDALTTALVRRLDIPGENVTAVAFDPADADVVFTSSYDSASGCDATVRAWSVARRAVLAKAAQSPCQGTALAVSDDGQTVAAGANNGDVLIWRWKEHDAHQETVNVAPSQYVSAIDIAQSGTSLVASAEKVTAVYTLTDPASNNWTRQGQLAHSDFAVGSVIDPTGTTFVSESRDGGAKVGDLSTGSLLADLTGHAGTVTDAAYLPDGRIVTSSEDGTARIWRLPQSRSLNGHTGWVVGVDVTPDGRTAVTGGQDGRILVWDLSTDKTIDAVPRADGDTTSRFAPPGLNGVTIDDSGRYIAAAGPNGVWVWDRHDLRAGPVASEPVSSMSVSFQPGGTRLALGLADGVQLWDWRSDAPSATVSTPGPAVVGWSPDGRTIAGGLSDGRVVIWDAHTLQLLRTMSGHLGQVWNVTFSRDGRSLASAGQDRSARVWDVATGTQRQALLGHRVRLAAVAFTPKGDRIVTGDADGFVGVWDARTGRRLSLTRVHGQSVNAATVLPDGTIVTASDDRSVRLGSCETCVSMEKLERTLRARLENISVVGPLPRSSESRLDAVEPGSCTANLLGGSSLNRATGVACDAPHMYELFAAFTIPKTAGAPFPGADALHKLADDWCGAEPFERYVGVPLDSSHFTLYDLTPDAASWANGRRRVLCLLTDPSGSSTGSARDARD